MKLRSLLVSLVALASLALPVRAQWNPDAGQWRESDPDNLRVMTWNVQDAICSTNTRKREQAGDWHALVCIVASMRPDVLIMQETGDNSGNGTGSGVDTVQNLTTTIDLFLHGGTDPFVGGQVTSFVTKYAPDYDLPYVFVSSGNDGFNRNVILSRYPFSDLNGDTKSQMSDIFFVSPDQWAPGGNGGIRGFMFAELNLPDDIYQGDTVIGCAHLKSGSTSSDHDDRVRAAQNVGYWVYYLYGGGGTGTPDPNGKISDSPQATNILPPVTPVIMGGDWNEDEVKNGGTLGPADWIKQGGSAGGSNGTDRDTTDSTYDAATEYFSGDRSTQSSSKLDYVCWWDSVATQVRAFVFRTSAIPSGKFPPELLNYPTPGAPNPALASNAASDHRPVIVDFQLPTQTQDPPGAFALLSPADGESGVATNPALQWQASSRATGYHLLLADNPGLTAPLVDADGLVTTSYAVPPGLLEHSATYYWGVTATNSLGSTDSSPFPGTFTTRAAPPPGDFALFAPNDGEQGVDREALLDWQDSPDADTYTLVIATDPGLTNTVLEVPGLVQSLYQLHGPVLSACSTYYWGVTAVNSVGQTHSTPYPATFGTEGIADFTGDGVINTIDFLLYLNLWNDHDPSTDVNLDGAVNTLDFLVYLNAYTSGC